MSDGTVEFRSVVETASRGSITFLFVAIVFMLVFGIVGMLLIDTDTLATLVGGIVLLIAFVVIIIFRQVVMEATATEVVLSYGTERVWIQRSRITSIEPFEMTPGRRVAALVSIGPWSAVGREKIHYFGGKSPMVLIRTEDGLKYAVSVENPEAEWFKAG